MNDTLRTVEDRYTDLLRHLASPSHVDAEQLADSLRQTEHLYSMGHITSWQLQQARRAYASTLESQPRQGPPPSLATLDQEARRE
ncbi:MAG TPA: hypothetical protein VFF72_08795 [Caldimonas sp.]|nr:hypothetical protein [Caldimonas sp.]